MSPRASIQALNGGSGEPCSFSNATESQFLFENAYEPDFKVGDLQGKAQKLETPRNGTKTSSTSLINKQVSNESKADQMCVNTPSIKTTTMSSVQLNTSSEPIDLSKRSDVIHKTIMRSMKRFILKRFRAMNPRIIKQRYTQTDGSELCKAMREVCLSIFGDIENLGKISKFVTIYSMLKPSDTFP